MSSSTAGADPPPDRIVWSSSLLSIGAGRATVFGTVAFLLFIVGAITLERHLRNDPLWKADDAVFLAIIGVNLMVLASSSGQSLDRAGVRPLRASTRSWNEVRRVFVKREHLVFDFGKPFWNRPWLILPKDPYDRARVRLFLDRAVSRERIIDQSD